MSGEAYMDAVEVEHWLDDGTEDWHANLVTALRSVYDPEIPLNIYDLGLVYRVESKGGGMAKVVMTLTSPSCPEAEAIPARVESELMSVAGTSEVEIEITWEPPWGPDRMSEDARLELGFY